MNDETLDVVTSAAGIGPDGNSRGDSAPAELPAIVDGGDFLAEEIPTPVELVHGILHKATKMVVGGGSKTFKTWTLSDLGLAVAFGEPWLSFKTSQGRVLFINFEIPPAFFQRRIRAIEQAKGITLTKGQFDIWNLRGFAASYDLLLPRIVDRTKERGYALIILDPIYKLYGVMDENKAGDVARLMNALEDLTVKTEAAVAFGAHYSKGNQSTKESIDRISGSGVFARDPDTILNFTRHQEKDAFTVEATLRNFKTVEPFVVRWQYPLMRRACDLDPAKLKQIRGRPQLYSLQTILEALDGKKLTTKQWLERAGSEFGVPKTQFYELLKQAKQSPEVKKTPKGQWLYEQRNEKSEKS